jgi:hypothetical protein
MSIKRQKTKDKRQKTKVMCKIHSAEAEVWVKNYKRLKRENNVYNSNIEIPSLAGIYNCLLVHNKSSNIRL